MLGRGQRGASGQRCGQLWAVILPGNTCPLFGQGAEQKAHSLACPRARKASKGHCSSQGQLSFRGQGLDSMASVDCGVGPSWPCSTPPPAPLTILGSGHLGQDAEGAGLKVGGAAGPLVSLILRLVLVLNHSLVHGGGAVHSQVFDRKTPAMQSDCGPRPGWSLLPPLPPHTDSAPTLPFPHCHRRARGRGQLGAQCSGWSQLHSDSSHRGSGGAGPPASTPPHVSCRHRPEDIPTFKEIGRRRQLLEVISSALSKP